MKTIFALASILLVILNVSLDNVHFRKSQSMTGIHNGLICPGSGSSDIIYVWALLTNNHHQTVSIREMLGIRTYSYDEIKGGFPSEGNVPVHMAQILREHGIEIVDNDEVCASITATMKTVTFTRDTSGMNLTYAKIDDFYYVMMRKGSNKSFLIPPIVKLDSSFKVQKVAELL